MDINVILRKINVIHKEKNEFYKFLLSRTKKKSLKKDYIFDELIKYIKEYKEIKCEILNKYALLSNKNKKLFLNEVKTIISYKRLMNLCNDDKRIPTIKKFNKYLLLLKIINKYIDNQTLDCHNRNITNASIALGYPHNWLIILRNRHQLIFKKYFCKCMDVDCYIENYKRMLNDYEYYKNNLINEYKSFDRVKKKDINDKFKEHFEKYDVRRLYRINSKHWFSLMILHKFLILEQIIKEAQ